MTLVATSHALDHARADDVTGLPADFAALWIGELHHTWEVRHSIIYVSCSCEGSSIEWEEDFCAALLRVESECSFATALPLPNLLSENS